jgi:hypothetical protein
MFNESINVPFVSYSQEKVLLPTRVVAFDLDGRGFYILKLECHVGVETFCTQKKQHTSIKKWGHPYYNKRAYKHTQARTHAQYTCTLRRTIHMHAPTQTCSHTHKHAHTHTHTHKHAHTHTHKHAHTHTHKHTHYALIQCILSRINQLQLITPLKLMNLARACP